METKRSHTEDFAILAPVPEEHLLDGKVVCEREGKVAFGSRAFERFRDADKERLGASVEVLIYASDPIGHRRAVATWRGLYLGHVDGRNGAHPDGMRFRPPSTANHPDDNRGHWAVFWEVTELRLIHPDPIPITRLRGLGKKKYYADSYVPEGPLLIEYPWERS